MLNHDHLFGPSRNPSRQLPPVQLANEFGEVSLRRVGEELQVVAALAMGAFVIGDGENCHVGLALDGSASMKKNYGRQRQVPTAVATEFINKGMFKLVEIDGVSRKVLTAEAHKQAMEQGLAERSKNRVRESAVVLIENMIRTFATGGAAKGQCEIIYWACEPGGTGIEPAGNVTTAQIPTLKIDGPRDAKFGSQTHLAPAFRHFLEKTGGNSGIFVFMTDGRIDDETAVIQMTHEIAGKMHAAGVYPPNVRCVLIGIGREIDEDQFSRIDDMPMPRELENYDIWNSKIFSDMRDMSDAWSEIFDPTAIIATRARVYDDQQNVVQEWTDGVKALISFSMPANSRSFELEIISGDSQVESLRIKQDLS
jgi:hypothetical protein